MRILGDSSIEHLRSRWKTMKGLARLSDKGLHEPATSAGMASSNVMEVTLNALNA